MLSNYPGGFPNGVTIRGVPILNLYPGKTYWVDSVHGQSGNLGTFDKPLNSIARALVKCTASHGDMIICKAGHIETVDSATALVLNKIGVAVVFLGSGANKAAINITAAAAYVDVTAAGCALIGPRITTGIDAVAKGILVEAADFFLGGGVEYYDGASKASTIQVLTTSAAARLCIDGYRYFASSAGTQKTDGIKTVGALDGVILRNIKIEGDFSTSPLDISAAITNALFENLYLNNTNASPLPAATFHANTTGFAKNVKARVASGTTYVSSVAKIQWGNDCEGFNTDGYGGDPIGTAMSSGVEGKVDSVGVQASVVQSKVDSAGIQVSTVQSKADSVGLGVSTVLSKADSVGLGVSTNTSKVDSSGIAVSTTQSTIVSKTDSNGLGVSTNQSQIGSVGVNTSTIISTLASIATRISMIASKDGL